MKLSKADLLKKYQSTSAVTADASGNKVLDIGDITPTSEAAKQKVADPTPVSEAAETTAPQQVQSQQKPRDYVDLALPSGTLWADKNIGANVLSDSGDAYNFVKSNRQPLLKPAESMPSRKQWAELMDPQNCKWKWCKRGSVLGFVVSSVRNNNYIFLPISGVSSCKGAYWTSENLNNLSSYCCKAMFETSMRIMRITSCPVDKPLHARPVKSSK